MKLVLSVSNGFEKYASVALHSFFKHHNIKEGVTIFIICETVTGSLEKLKWFEKKHSCSIYFKVVDVRLLSHSVVNGHVSIATYFRLLLAEMLPNESKVLYLDCDLLINGSLLELWNKNIDKYAIGAVQEKKFAMHEKLGFPLGKPYFNAGVLLINLNFWRSNDLTKQYLNFLKINSERISFWDQDVLNMVLQDHCLFIEEKWNYVPTQDHIENGVAIIHFAGAHKPWEIHYPYPKIKRSFLKYCLHQPFATVSYLQYAKAVVKSIA